MRNFSSIPILLFLSLSFCRESPVYLLFSIFSLLPKNLRPASMSQLFTSSSSSRFHARTPSQVELLQGLSFFFLSFSSLPSSLKLTQIFKRAETRPPDMKSRDGRSTPVCILDYQIVEHLLPTLPFLPSTSLRPIPTPVQPLKDPSLDIEGHAEEPPPPAYPAREESRRSNWKKIGKVLRLVFCGAREYLSLHAVHLLTSLRWHRTLQLME